MRIKSVTQGGRKKKETELKFGEFPLLVSTDQLKIAYGFSFGITLVQIHALLVITPSASFKLAFNQQSQLALNHVIFYPKRTANT